MLRFLGPVILSAALALGVLAAPAHAAGFSPPVADCYANGRLTHHYSVAELRNALATMPADVREYSPCYNVLQQALLAQIGNLHGGGSGGGGSFLPTWLIVVIVLLVLGGAGFGAVALRNRGQEP